MRFWLEQNEDRREFFRDLLRYGCLGLLTAVAAISARAFSGPKCVSRGICRGCPAFAGCELPRALSARSVLTPPASGAGGSQSKRTMTL